MLRAFGMRILVSEKSAERTLELSFWTTTDPCLCPGIESEPGQGVERKQ